MVFRLAVMVAVAAACTPIAAAQADACIQDKFGKPPSPTLSLNPEAANAYLQRVSKAMGFDEPVTAIPCGWEVDNVEAWKNTSNPAYPAGNYVAYKDSWLRLAANTNQAELFAVFAHEIGHFKNGDFSLPRSAPDFRKQRELAADEEAGCGVAKLNSSFEGLQSMIEKVRSLVDDGKYFPIETSLAAARKGFSKCEGQGPARMTPRDEALFALSKISALNWSSATSLEIIDLLLVDTNVAGLKQAATSNPRAQLVMGWVVARGELTARDDQASLDYYATAVTSDDPRAKVALGAIYERGTLVQQDMRKALNLYKAAADAKNAHGQYAYARFLEAPPMLPGGALVVEPDKQRAKALYLAAAKQGLKVARIWAAENGLTP